jgi:putative inorganic carbon (hco3(-)) transporter
MDERLTFNHGVVSLWRTRLEGTSLETKPVRAEPPHAPVSAYQPPVERPTLAFWCVFLFTALLFVYPHASVPGLASVRLTDVVAVVALLALARDRLGHGLPILSLTPEVAGVMALATVMLVTVPFSVSPGSALATFTNQFLKVALIFVLLVHSLRGPRLLRTFAWLIVLAMGLVALGGVLDYVNLLDGIRLRGAVPGVMGTPDEVALNMVTFLPFAIFIAIGRGGTMARLIAGGIALLMVATVLSTKSYGGLLGLAAMGLVVAFQTRRVRLGVVITLIAAGLMAAPLLPPAFWTRVSSIANLQENAIGSRQARKDLMDQAWLAFTERPLTGVGAGQLQNDSPPGRPEPSRRTQNVLLQVAGELGVLGCAAFLYLLWRAAVTLVRAKRIFPNVRRRSKAAAAAARLDYAFRPDERAWMRLHVSAVTAGFVGWFVGAQFATVGYSWTFYYLLALITVALDIAVERFRAAAQS